MYIVTVSVDRHESVFRFFAEPIQVELHRIYGIFPYIWLKCMVNVQGGPLPIVSGVISAL